MATMKRENPTANEQEQPHSKRLKNDLRVVLNPADCDLAFNIEADGLTGHALYEQGFAYCWSGARGNIGITGGKYYFGCRIISDQPVIMEETPLDQQHVSRIGVSRGDAPVGNLGETKGSFGYGGTGKFSTNAKFVDYGERFGIGDTITCLVDLESKPCASVEFSKNGKRLGIAKYLDEDPKSPGAVSPTGNLSWKSALFPHVLLKNTVVKMQFSTEDGLVPEEGYKPWASAVNDGNAVIGPAFSDSQACEVIMMVGLPASGKTTWAENWVKEHPEKRYILLGTNLSLDQMKVPGLQRKSNYGERFDRLMDRATGIFNTLLSRACKVPRNYIIDQTNVYKSARRRKLKPFANFHKIAVVVFPRQDELKFRAEKRFKEMGKEVPPEAVNEMLANYVLPMSKDMLHTEEYFDEVIFTELSRGEAQQQLDEMKRAPILSSSMKSKGDHSSYSRESSVHSNFRLSACGPGQPYSQYSSPSLGLQTDFGTGSWIGPPGHALQPNPANAIRGYTGQSVALESVQPRPLNYVNTRYESPGFSGRIEAPGSCSYPGSLNSMPPRNCHPGTYSSYSSPALGNNFTQLDGGNYLYDPHRIHESACSYGTRYGNSAEEAILANQFNVSQTPYSRPQGSYSADVRHPGAALYHPPRYY
ncbi:heterogeneous nuclear ribonucleoprotein U-like protein 1 isoform X2 [Chenopodium quinoa]|uniref:B30.2/SPRY domain-containing protein n=1 Tax=Chenopodium quinoa TaxID=63459 RepID=A0A803LL71_CHEQI|nr:heterogeneous nuclear ribonucleoprotein U-like protein 1 isoform X2 [Chenopodium quinoa]